MTSVTKSEGCYPIIDKTNGIIRTVRLQAPSHFVWKIESYSELLLSKWEKIESGTFQVDDRKWKLTFFPNGDHKHKGKGYISLYLSVLDTDELPLSCDLSVKFQFLVFDQIHDNYLVIQDVRDVFRFQRMKTEWGFAMLLSLDEFKDPSNGYLLDDCCIFGVDLFVIKGATRVETFSVIKPRLSANSCSFKIEKFSTIEEEYVKSEEFTIKDMQWKLKLYPKGDSDGKDHVSVYLLLASDKPDYSSKVYTKFKFRLIDQVHSNHLERECNYGFYDSNGWGFPCFVSLSKVNDASKGYLLKDTMIVEAQIDYLSTVKHFS
ncbi:hypothetical protein ACFE04_010752 [Oxalis oulophora]